MRPLEIAIGQRFGRLVVTGIVSRRKTKGKGRVVISKCDCGNINESEPWALMRGKTQSCGCYWRERTTKHGLSHHRVYGVWISMLNRCFNPKTHGYERYGGKGIVVCDRWRNSFSDFISDMGMPPNQKAQLDRIDGAKNYEPGNVRWTSPSLNQTNRRRNWKRTGSASQYFGVSRTKDRWSAAIGVPGRKTRRHIGKFTIEEEAARAYDAVARQYGFPLNFPE